ncbi:F-box/WD repeat-containing protein 10-like [Periplaneta americana]|uniref:F-box/WD repeat-containing protein 10-like n=1 Tax=Periplaneta americana TaxID=6978 RepID=UPI0037E814D6
MQLKDEFKEKFNIRNEKLREVRNAIATLKEQAKRGKVDKWEKEKKGQMRRGRSESQDENVDMVQILPLTVNRSIVKLLDEETAMKAKKVNGYWAAMIEDVMSERKMKDKLHNDIAFLETQRKSSLLRRDSDESSRLSSSVEHIPGNKAVLLQLMKSSQLPGSKKIKEIYLQKHLIFTITTSFMPRRVTACDTRGHMMAVTVPGRNVEFCSLLTSVTLQSQLSGHSSTVTCLAFHPDGGQIFTGSTDKTIRQQVAAHESDVSNLHLTSPILISASLDGLVKVWRTDKPTTEIIQLFSHECPVTDASLAFMRVLTVCQNGHLRVWDLLTGNLERLITVTQYGQPIQHIHCIQGNDFCKVVVSGETIIKVYEFSVRPPRKKKTGKASPTSDYRFGEELERRAFRPKVQIGLKKTTFCAGGSTINRVTGVMQRNEHLSKRGAADSSLRYPRTQVSVPKSIITDLLKEHSTLFSQETRTLSVFPRPVITNDQFKIPLEVPKNVTWPEVEPTFTKRKVKKPEEKTCKHSLKLHKVFETSM